MPRQVVYTCVVCGQPRQSSNHWFVAQNTSVGFHLRTWDWAVREDQLDESEYLCGRECAHKLLDGFMEESSKIALDR
jgi:hypothetical protein